MVQWFYRRRRRQGPFTACPRLRLACFCVQQSRWVRDSLSGQVHTSALVFEFCLCTQKFVIHGCRKQAISKQDPAWVIHITLQYRNNIQSSHYHSRQPNNATIVQKVPKESVQKVPINLKRVLMLRSLLFPFEFRQQKCAELLPAIELHLLNIDLRSISTHGGNVVSVPRRVLKNRR